MVSALAEMSGHWDMQNNQDMKEDVEEYMYEKHDLLCQAFDAIEELMDSLDTLSNHSNPKWVNLAKATDALSNGKLALDAINQALYEDL